MIRLSADLDKEIAELEASLNESEDTSEQSEAEQVAEENITQEPPQEEVVHNADKEVVELIEESEVQALAPAESVAEAADSEIANEMATDDTEVVQSSGFKFQRPPSEGDLYIPVLDDARVFAEYIDKLPAVVNYFTMAPENEVISFYQQVFGDIIVQERKRGRLTLSFISDTYATRVVISEQDDRRQVDVIQELTK